MDSYGIDITKNRLKQYFKKLTYYTSQHDCLYWIRVIVLSALVALSQVGKFTHIHNMSLAI